MHVLDVIRAERGTMEPIRVYVVDDHPMIRHGLAAMLGNEPGVRWVGDAGDGAEAVRSAPALDPHIVLMDMLMPRMDGVATITALRPLLPLARFVVLAGVLEPAEVRRAMSAGASGFLLKNATAQELISVIRTAHQGHAVLAPEVNSAMMRDADAPGSPAATGADLTQRERELLALMARGLSNNDISKALAIAMPTVKFHVTNILAKLHADNRTEAVLVALRHRIVRLE
jgi:two-component system, NarL family, response regulator LiaR